MPQAIGCDTDVAVHRSSWGVLHGVRVLDVSRLAPGAFVTRWLADLGAEVLKVEEAGRGDYLRKIPPYVEGQGLIHALADRGKASLALDFRSHDDLSLLQRLAAVADVIVDGSRPGATNRMGIDLEDLRRTRPALVVCSITGFGRTGALASVASHGMTIETLAGIANVVPRKGGGWRVVGSFPVNVELGVLSAVIGTLAALMNVRNGGAGAWIDASLWDAAVEANRLNVALAYRGDDGRVIPGDQGPLHAVYECIDGQLIMFAPIEKKFWERFCIAVEREDLLDKWASQGEVGFGEAGLGAELAELFATRTASEWASLLEGHDVPGNVVLDVDDVVQHPHFRDRALVEDGVRPSAIPNLLAPLLLVESGDRPGASAEPAPILGERGRDLATRWLTVQRPDQADDSDEEQSAG